MRHELDRLRGEASARLGDVLSAVGAEIRRGSSPDRGAARCPFACSQGFAISYAKGRARCFYEAKSWDAFALVQELDGVDFPGAVDRVAGILGEGPPERPSAFTRRTAATRITRPIEDVAALWDDLPERDEAGEAYLRNRGLWHGSIPEVLRFNPPGASRDGDLSRRAEQGYRVAFLARDAIGRPSNISLRFVSRRAGQEPPENRKAVTLRGRTTKDCAIYRPGLLEVQSDPDAYRNALLFCEGGPDFLAWDEFLAEDEPPTWALGCIGAGIARDVVRAFAPFIGRRFVRIALDADAAGQEASTRASDAAWESGALRVTRVTFDGFKDAAEAAEVSSNA